jgi:hypothetical protein
LVEEFYSEVLRRRAIETPLALALLIPGLRRESSGGSGCVGAEVASLISATIQSSSIARNSSPGFANGSVVLFIACSYAGAGSGQFQQAIRA